MTKASELAHLAAIILAPNLIGFLQSKSEGDRQKHEVRDEAVKMAVRTAAAVLAASEDYEQEHRQARALDRVPAGGERPSQIRFGYQAQVDVRSRPQDNWRT